MSADFDARFRLVTGRAPFPWQRALYERFVDNKLPERVILPTGLGKTSIVALWLLALAAHAPMPKRLVYVVNRRTVVDQTTREVERLQKHAEALGLAQGLAVSTLRGQHVDNRAWSADPSRPAVICGTVDMIGSRLLFSGYGAGFKTRPLLAGFLGQDSLIVHDEAHLEPAFQSLLESVRAAQGQTADGGPRRMRLIELTATSRGGAADEFGLGADDEQNPAVMERIGARKKLTLYPHGPKDLVEGVCARALEYRESNAAILVFLQTVDAAGKVTEALKKANLQVRMLAGTMRGKERDQLVDSDPVFQRFIPEGDRKPEAATVYLVSTSAGEVGVNISADHLISDLTPFDSMAQRFGRVNRFGLRSDTEVSVFHPEPGAMDASNWEQARARTLAILEGLKGDVSPRSLARIDAEARKNAFTPAPQILKVSEMQFDAWTLTSIRQDLPGRPSVEPYLHGVAEWEPPQTKVAWRDEVDLILLDTPLGKRLLPSADDLLADYPLKPHELLTDSTTRVVSTLLDAVDRHPPDWDPPIWVVTEFGVEAKASLRAFVAGDKKRLEQRLANTTLLLSPRFLPPDGGFLRASPRDEGATGDVSALEPATNSPDALRRYRVLSAVPNPAQDPGMRRIRSIDLREEDENAEAADDEDASPRYWNWYESARSADGEGSRSTSQRVTLDVHLRDVARAAERICSTLNLGELAQLVVKAGALHDVGKRRRVWQLSIGNATCPPFLAKSGPEGKPREGTKYRHELGSILDEETGRILAGLSDEDRDLVLHLVAAHHGRARPHFADEELFDPEVRGVDVKDTGLEVIRRFARLQHRYGRWGLAYLESLLRAADYAASADPTPEEAT